MREPFTQLYVHLVWATWDRAPLLDPGLFNVVDACVRSECEKLRVNVEAFGGIADQVHLLARLPTTLSVANLAKQVKGSTSHLLTQKLNVPFKWQGAYGAFTVSKRLLGVAREYVLNQEEHHRNGTTIPGAELSPAADFPRTQSEA